MKFVLASANPGKVGEMRSILNGCGFEVVTRYDLGIDVDIAETGATFLENAVIKAKVICEISGLPSIADDSGLVVDVLGGEPGVDTSSYGGDTLTDEERCEYLLKKMENVEPRGAKFVCIIACALPGGELITAEGECRGEISMSLRVDSGFGFDPIFLIPNSGKTLAELAPDEKNAISHRGKALRAFTEKMEKIQNSNSVVFS